MSVIDWTDEMKVFVAILDQQHRAIIDCINRLGVAAEGEDDKGLAKGLDDLIYLTHTHFVAEEKLLERSGYPGLQKQQRDHRDFLSRLEQLRVELPVSGPAIARTAAEYAGRWLGAHVRGADLAYCEFLREKGIT